MSSRNQVGDKFRRITVSHDGGETWEPYRLAKDLVTPQCMASVIRKGDLLVHSLPNASGRRDGAIMISRDEGESWERVHTITPEGFAYSSLSLLTEGSVVCLYEGDGYQTIRLARIPDAVFEN
jgi:sialidase-1